MTFPTLLFALLLALFIGALYHLVRGGGAWHLIVYLIASVAGYAVGHLIGLWRKWELFEIGPFNLGLEVTGALIVLITADLLLHMESHSGTNEE